MLDKYSFRLSLSFRMAAKTSFGNVSSTTIRTDTMFIKHTTALTSEVAQSELNLPVVYLDLFKSLNSYIILKIKCLTF